MGSKPYQILLVILSACLMYTCSALTGSDHKYTFGTQVELTAVSDFGWNFSRWEGDVTGS
ncbi:MAG: hypothetical protein WD272_06345 [Balneolales bacterium]